ncbi:Transposable element Tcb2 transposase, partial [Harpegnathos saltator]
SVSAVQRGYTRNLETNSFQRRSVSGRLHITDERDDQFIVLNSLRNRHQTAVQIQNSLRDVFHNNVCVNTVRNRMRENGFFARRPAGVLSVTCLHRVARLDFVVNRRHWMYADWSNILFSDEFRYALFSPGGRER